MLLDQLGTAAADRSWGRRSHCCRGVLPWLVIAAANAGCSDERDVLGTEATPTGHSSVNWVEALESMESASEAEYSYLIASGDGETSPYHYGASLLIGPHGQLGVCATSEDGRGDGWWLYLWAGELEGGEYFGEWGRSHALSEGGPHLYASFERWSGGSIQHYAVFSANLTLDGPVIEYERSSQAQDITGHVRLVLPSTPVWQIECRALAAAGEEPVSGGCDCLVDETRIETCYPESPSDICCMNAVPDDRVVFEIPFRAKPCAGLCAYSSLVPPSLCESLETSGFNDTSTP